MLVLTADRIITGDGKTVIENAYVKLDDNGIIAEAGEKTGFKVQNTDVFVNYEGCSIMPGLFDMHVHLANWWKLPDKVFYNDYLIALYSANNMKTALSKGITTVRDVMSPNALMKSLKYAVKSKFIQAPRIFHTNQAITPTGGHCHDNHGSVVIADGVENVRSAVRLQVREGADWVKAMGNHADKIDYTLEEMSAIVNEVHRLGKKCCVHASITDAIEIAIEAGADTIEHGTFMTEKQAEKLVKTGQVWVPTLSAYFYWSEKIEKDLNDPNATAEALAFANELQGFIAKGVKTFTANLKKYYDMGVKIVTGSDIIAAAADYELKLMCQLGLPPLRAIECATSAAAEVCGIGNTVGKIAANYLGDILVVKGNPLADINAINNVREVYQEGKSVYTNP